MLSDMQYLALFVAVMLCALTQAQQKHMAKRYRDEQRELLKWQTELEKKASQMHK